MLNRIFFCVFAQERFKRSGFQSMKCDMSAHLPRIARIALAICLCFTSGLAVAEEEEFSEGWLAKRELEMTRDLTLEIERENSDSVARRVVVQLAGSDAVRLVSAAPLAAFPAAPDLSAGIPGTPGYPTLHCETDLSGSYACIIRPAR